MSDARMFAELTERVTALELRLQELADRVEGKDVSDEVLGPVADESVRAEDRAARDGFRTLLERGGVTIAEEAVPAAAGAVPEVSDLATDPLLKDKLAALQGGEAQKPEPSKPSVRK